MIVFIDGQLSEIGDGTITISVNGVGYQIHMGIIRAEQMPNLGERIKVSTYHHVREDQQLLFGFLNPVDRDTFILVTGVSGIGPKLALKLVSSLSTGQLIKAIAESNWLQMTQVPGIGKRMAERLIVELKNKTQGIVARSGDTPGISETSGMPMMRSTDDDVMAAMRALGYSASETSIAISNVKQDLQPDMNTATKLKWVLKHIS